MPRAIHTTVNFVLIVAMAVQPMMVRGSAWCRTSAQAAEGSSRLQPTSSVCGCCEASSASNSCGCREIQVPISKSCCAAESEGSTADANHKAERYRTVSESGIPKLLPPRGSSNPWLGWKQPGDLGSQISPSTPTRRIRSGHCGCFQSNQPGSPPPRPALLESDQPRWSKLVQAVDDRNAGCRAVDGTAGESAAWLGPHFSQIAFCIWRL